MSFEEVLVEQCAPTLAKIKPANLFYWKEEAEIPLQLKLKKWRKIFRQYGLEIIILKKFACSGAYLIYVCRPEWLENILLAEDSRAFLSRQGYKTDSLEMLLAQLAGRLQHKEDFPHEIGLFLGYPLEDVTGFIRERGKNYRLCGHWKVYGDAQKARHLFNCYQKCTCFYKRMMAEGAPLKKLLVAA